MTRVEMKRRDSINTTPLTKITENDMIKPE